MILRVLLSQLFKKYFVFILNKRYYFTWKLISCSSPRSVDKVDNVLWQIILNHSMKRFRKIQTSWSKVRTDQNVERLIHELMQVNWPLIRGQASIILNDLAFKFLRDKSAHFLDCFLITAKDNESVSGSTSIKNYLSGSVRIFWT